MAIPSKKQAQNVCRVFIALAEHDYSKTIPVL